MSPSRSAAARQVFLAALALLLAVVAAVLLAPHVPAVRVFILREVETRLTHYAGREVRVERVDFRPLRSELELFNVRVAGGSGADGALFAADSIRLDWRWKPLLHRSLVLDQILLARPRLALPPATTSAAPSAEWITHLLGPRPVPFDGWALDLRRLELQAGSAAWETGGTTGRLDGITGVVERRQHGGDASFGATLRASRLFAPVGGALRDAAELALEMDGTAQGFTITRLEGVVEGTHVTGKGRIVDPVGAGQLELELAVSSPLTALLKQAGVAEEVDGFLKADGHLRGPWGRPAYRGKVSLHVSKAPHGREPMVFDLSWADNRLEVETPQTTRSDAFRAKLFLEPATGSYGARFTMRNTDLGELTGVPAVLAQMVGFTLPEEFGGRLTADVDLVGRGTDLATLRGYGTLRVDGLSVEAGLPTGRAEARVRATASRLTLETFTLDVPGGTVQGKGSVAFADGQVNVPVQADIRSMAALGRGFGLPTLGGAATLRGRLTGTRHAPRFQGHLAWREPQVAVYAADQIEGDVEWLPRMLRSSGLVARLGQTVVLVQGSVVAQGLAPLRALDPKKDLTLDLAVQVSPGRTADLAPFLPAQLPVRGAFRAGGRIAGTPLAPTGEVEVAFASVQTWDEQWQRGSALLRLTPAGIDVTQLSMQRGGEQLSGDLRIDRDGTLTGRISTTPMDLTKIRALSESQVGGRAAFVLDMQGTLHATRILGKATADAILVRDVPFGPGIATFTIDKKALDLDLAVREGSQRLRLRLDPPPDRRLKLELSLSNADLAPLLRVAGIEALSGSRPRGTGRIVMGGSVAALADAAGEATFEVARFQWRGETWENRGPIEVAWQGREATLRQARIQSRIGELDIRGTVTGNGESNLQVRADFPLAAVVSHLPILQNAGGSGSADLQIRGALAAPEISGTVQIKNATTTLAGVPAPIEDLQGTVALEGERALIRSLQGRIAGGSLRATGEIAWHGGAWSVQTAFQEEGGRAEQLLAGLSDGKGKVTGALSLGGTLTSRGVGAEGFRQNLGGNLKLDMLDGQFGRQSLMLRLLSLFKLGELLDPKSPGMASQGMPYRRLTADIAIDRGVARTENLFLESRAFNLSAHGEVDLANETINMNVAVKPFQALDKAVTKVPVVGWLLSGKDGSVIAAFYRVSGSLSSPTVATLPAKDIGRNVFGVFQRLLELPEDVTGAR